jgi:catechol 2,3-dioxygenase-like lactoylglutathione lyase family enzyme
VSIFGSTSFGLDLYHVGLVVPDLEAAMHDYGELFGFEWATVGPPRTQHVMVGGERRDAEIAVTYSTQGPPHLELIEERSGGVWAAESPLNHVGFWAPDLADAVARLTNAGFPAEVHDAGSDGDDHAGPTVFSYHPIAGGFWMELVGTGFQPQLEAWIASSAGT